MWALQVSDGQRHGILSELVSRSHAQLLVNAHWERMHSHARLPYHGQRIHVCSRGCRRTNIGLMDFLESHSLVTHLQKKGGGGDEVSCPTFRISDTRACGGRGMVCEDRGVKTERALCAVRVSEICYVML